MFCNKNEEIKTSSQQNWRKVPGISVLCYHQLYTSAASKRAKYDFNISVNQFRRQLQILKSNGYTTIQLDQLIQYLQGGVYPAGKPIVISFDDGTADFLKLAEPALREYGFSATHFIAPALIDNVPGHMKLKDLKKTIALGYEIQSHGFAHLRMNKISAWQRQQELQTSATWFIKQGIPSVRHFAYPEGIYTADMPEILQTTGFFAAYTVYEGENIPGQPLPWLNRYLVRSSDSDTDFLSKVKQRPLPILSLSPERGSLVSEGQTIYLLLPADIMVDQLLIKVHEKKITPQILLKDIIGQHISFVIPTTSLNHRWYYEIKIELKEQENQYRSTFLYLAKKISKNVVFK